MTCKHADRKGVTLQENVTAVLTASTTDVLSHVAIRARSQKVRGLLSEPQQIVAERTSFDFTFLRDSLTFPWWLGHQ